MKSIYHFFSSIRLTVVLLALSVMLVFFGTLEQVHHGIYQTQKLYFEHMFVVWAYPDQWLLSDQLSWVRFPLPGGYVIGPLLVLNLIFAHFKYYRSGWGKAGIVLIHGGLVLLLLGQFWTQVGQKEYFMWLGEGESNNYAESFHHDELVIIDRSHPERDQVYSWPVAAFSKGSAELTHPDLPFRLRVIGYALNAAIFPRDQIPEGGPSLGITHGIAAERDMTFISVPPTYKQGERNVTTALVDVLPAEGLDASGGRWLVSNVFRQEEPRTQIFPRQTFEIDGRTYEIAFRFERRYLPEYIRLLEFRHDRYPGTDIPFNFSSEITIGAPDGAGARKALIYMNNPLRFDNLTFYQASFAEGDTRSMFQVVENPARWVPYAASLVITFGLLLQFGISFYKNLRPGKRGSAKNSASPAEAPSGRAPSAS